MKCGFKLILAALVLLASAVSCRDKKENGKTVKYMQFTSRSNAK